MKAIGSFLDSGLGKARGLEEAAGNSGVACGVEGRRRFGLVGSDCGVGVERCGGAEVDFNIVEGAFAFDDAVPAGWRARFGKSGSPASPFASGGAGFHGGYGVAVEKET